MRVVGANLVVSIKSFYREKTARFFTIAFPILLILVFGTIFMDQENVRFALYVQDLDHTEFSARLIETLKLTGKFKITKVEPAINATQYAKDNKLNLVLIIPEGYERSFDQRIETDDPNTTVTITYTYDPSSSSVSTKMQILNLVFARINQETFGKPSFIRTAETSILPQKYRFIEFFIPGIIAMAVMTASLFGTVNLSTELRQKGVIRKLSTTPITRTEWVLSNILYQFILAFVGIGMILTRFVKEAQSAAAAANAIMFPMMFLSGSFFPIEMMPGFLQTLARILPLYYVNEGLRASMVFVDNMTALRYSAIIGIFAAVVFILGIMATKWEEGK
jgi:ABC-2 type transport system permease protein